MNNPTPWDPDAERRLPDELLRMLDVPPRRLALWLAVIGGDMPGFDNRDRATLRRAALALTGAAEDPDAARQIVREAVLFGRGALEETHRLARPEIVLMAAVYHLLSQQPGTAPSTDAKGPPPVARARP